MLGDDFEDVDCRFGKQTVEKLESFGDGHGSKEIGEGNLGTEQHELLEEFDLVGCLASWGEVVLQWMMGDAG